ncbi:MAG: ABC transporter ATP-binding protein [Bacteroidota bacterium]
MRSLRHLNRYFVKYKWRFLLGICFVTISNLFGIFPAQLTRNALDAVAGNIDAYKMFDGFNYQKQAEHMLIITSLMFGMLVILMALLKGVFMFLMRQTIIVMSRLIEYDMKNEIYQKYQQLDQAFYNRNNTGDLMNRISEDVSRVRMYVGPAVMYTINLVVLFILVISAMVHVNMRLTFYVLLPLPVLTFVVYYVHDLINKRSERVQEQLSSLSTFVQEAFSGIRVIKSYAREKAYSKLYADQSEEFKNVSMNLVKVNALFMPSMLLLVGLSTILTIYVGSLEVMNGRLTIGNIAEFVIYVNMLTWPVASLGWTVTLVQRAAASQERINEFLHTEPVVVSGTRKEILKGKIEFKNVSVQYHHTGTVALKNISFTVNPGESVAVTGRTGSGKSSLVNLLLRMMDPDNGTIYIDGIDLKYLDRDYYLSQTGCVPQEVFLFSDTIEENISFGLPEKADKTRMEQAASDADVYDNIMELPKGFQTLVGERGITLSGGQKQRVSIARALIRNPSLLILDDCLSAVDTLTEEKILANLTRIMKNRTTIIVSHRVSTVKDADQIIVLDEGRIVEQGNHQQLIAKEGLYASLYQMQLMEDNG